MSHRKLLVHVMLLVVSAAVFSVMAHAQYRGSIQGVVTDPQGALVPGATITLKNKETNQTLTATSSDSGIYNFNALPPSRYAMTVEKTGFKKKVLEDFGIISEQANAVNIELELGQSTETVTVTDATPLIDTQTAQLSNTIDSRQIKTLPSFNRDPYTLAQLAPGVFGDGARDAGSNSRNLPGTNSGACGASGSIFCTENAPQVIANGSPLNSNGITIDGVNIVSVTWGGAAIITPNEESIKEIKVVSNGYDAENGRFGGAQIKVISNNGTNDYHGSLFFKADRPGLNAFQKYNGPFGGLNRNTSRFNQYGGSVGGPILKNKLFGFFSYETQRNKSSSTGSGWYETPQFLQSTGAPIATKFLTFPGMGVSSTRIHDVTCSDIGLVEGTNCQAIAGQGLDLGRPLDPELFPAGTPDPSWASNLNPGLGGDGTGDPANLDGVPDFMLVDTIGPSKTSEWQWNLRVDYNATASDLVAVSMYRVPLHSQSYNGPARPMNFFHHDAINEAETALWNHTFSPTLLNEFRINAASWRWNELASNPQEPYGLPTDNIDTLGTVGPQNFGAQGLSIFDQWTYNLKDTVTKVYKSHTMKFGADVTRLLFLDEAPWSARPSYSFRNLWNFANDAPYSESGSFDPQTGIPTDVRKDTRNTILGLFAQDDYKARPNLTLNLGLRWEYFGPLHEKNNRLSTVLLGSGSGALTGMRLKQGGDLASAPKSNFGPQLGFAWSPRGIGSHDLRDKLVLRGGFGVAYTGLEAAITLNGRANPPLVSGFYLTDSNVVYAVPDDVHQFAPYPSNPNTIQEFDSNTFLPTSGAPIGLTGFPSHLATATTYRYSLDGQYDLGRNWVATFGYQGSLLRHFTRQINMNLLYPTAMNPMVQDVDWYTTDANGRNDAILAGVRHSFSRNFQLDAQYRWGKSRDQATQPYYVDNYQWDRKLAWGPSDFDVTHALKIWGVYTTPKFFHGDQAWMDKIVGGWSISGILNVHSGFPWTPFLSQIPGEEGDLNACNTIYAGSGYQGGGQCNLRPATYTGGAGSNYSTDTFKKQGGNFPDGGLSYFTPPTFQEGPSFSDIVNGLADPGPLPQVPAVRRNSFRGPRYFNIDMSLVKSFGLPKMPVLGENARFEFRADFFNVFNKLNLNNVQGNLRDPYFGTAMDGLSGRTIELQARFNF